MKQNEVIKYISRLDNGDDLDEFECSEPEHSNEWVEFEKLDEDYLEYLADMQEDDC